MKGLKSFAWVLCLVACIACSKEKPSEDKNTTKTEFAEGQQESDVHIIEIRQMKFQPAEIRVKKGDKIRWINRDITNHDVTEQSSRAWASSPLATGESWSMVATETVDYYCNLHQVMKGKIIVE